MASSWNLCRLIKDGAATEQELKAIRAAVQADYDKAFEESKTWEAAKDEWLSSHWAGFKSPGQVRKDIDTLPRIGMVETSFDCLFGTVWQLSRIRETGVHIDRLREVGLKTTEMPPGFKLHKQLERIIGARRKTIEEGQGIDWATAEALAFGSLLLEGNHVRLTGQDVERGTFSHRHCVLHDQATNETHCPLNHIRPNISNIRATADATVPNTQARFLARNSILSEFGVLGFELGYSLENPNALVLWEAQFGDFVNGAQVRYCHVHHSPSMVCAVSLEHKGDGVTLPAYTQSLSTWG